MAAPLAIEPAHHDPNAFKEFKNQLPMLKPFLAIAATFRAIEAFKTVDIAFGAVKGRRLS